MLWSRPLLPLAVLLALALGAGPIRADEKNSDDKKMDDKSKRDEPPLIAKSREKLDTKVTVDFKDEKLKDLVQELGKQADLSIRIITASGVSNNMSFTYSAKDKPLREVLDEMFKGKGVGYVIHRKQNATDRYEGYIDIVQGDQRGDEIPKKELTKGALTKPKTPAKSSGKTEKPTKADDAEAAERTAAAKLRNAKRFIEDAAYADAREYLEEIIKKYPKTAVVDEAKELLEKIKGKK